MVTMEAKLKAECRARELLGADGFAQPETVEYGEGCLRLCWHSLGKVIVIDVTEDGQIGESRLGIPSAPV